MQPEICHQDETNQKEKKKIHSRNLQLNEHIVHKKVNYLKLAYEGPKPLIIKRTISENSVSVHLFNFSSLFKQIWSFCGTFVLNRRINPVPVINLISIVYLLKWAYFFSSEQVNQFRTGTQESRNTPFLMFCFVFIFKSKLGHCQESYSLLSDVVSLFCLFVLSLKTYQLLSEAG